jgi:hypothetical protein
MASQKSTGFAGIGCVEEKKRATSALEILSPLIRLCC